MTPSGPGWRAWAALVLVVASPGLAAAQTQPPTARDTGWRSDIDAFVHELGRQHFVFSRSGVPATLVRAAARLRDSVPALSDERMLVELQRLAALAGDGHTCVLPMGLQWIGPFFLGFRGALEAVLRDAARPVPPR